MNDGHQRHLASTYQHVDTLLRKAEAILSGAESQAPFGQVVLDTEPWQREVLQQYATRVRGLLKATLDRFGIVPPGPCIPASRSAFVLFMGAEIDLEELRGNNMRNYGFLPPEETAALAAANEEIIGVLGEMRRFLVASSGRDPEVGTPPREPGTDEPARGGGKP